MGNSVLKGISAALLVTVITLLAGLFWTALGFEGLSTTTLVDIGLVASCIAAGYVTGKESGQWVLGGASGLGYVLVCVFLIALFLELRAWGVIQVLAEGGLVGILAGAFGAGNEGRTSRSSSRPSWRTPRVSSWGDGYSGRGAYSGSQGRSCAYEEWDDHVDDWDDLLENEDQQIDANEEKWENWQRGEKSKVASNNSKAWWEEDVL